MDNRFKIIIIVCLVFIVSIFGSYSYFSINNATKTNNSSNANITVQNSTGSSSSLNQNSGSTQSGSNTNLISAQRAIDIVEQSNPNKNAKIRFSAELKQNNGAPYYLVTVYDTNRNSSTYGQGIGGAKVDARTGVILDELG
ncbi:MAG: PepSY domain-containing protein [Methanobacterium sp.]